MALGGTALAMGTVLAICMGGMALGTWIGGVVADRAKAAASAVREYALGQLVIGLYAAATPLLFRLIQKLYAAWAADVPTDAPSLPALRVLLSVAVLIVPTVSMGAPLPLAYRHLARTTCCAPIEAIAPLYGAKVLGAALGAAGRGLCDPARRRSHRYHLDCDSGALNLLVALHTLDRAKKMGAPVAGLQGSGSAPESTRTDREMAAMASADAAAATPWQG